MSEPIQVQINCVTKEEIEKISAELLNRKLIACADIFPVESNYWWKGRIEKESRWQAVCHTLYKKKAEIIDTVESLHSDEITGIVFTQIDANEKYSNWIIESIGGK